MQTDAEKTPSPTSRPLTLNDTSVVETPIDFTRLFYMLYNSIEFHTGLADRKAQILLTVNAILIAALGIQRDSVTNILFNENADILEQVSLIASLLAALSVVASVVFALMSTKPNLRRTERPTNLFFFGDAAELDEETFLNGFMNLTMHEIKTTVITQIHAKSHVLVGKFRHLRNSMLLLLLALSLWVASIIVLALV